MKTLEQEAREYLQKKLGWWAGDGGKHLYKKDCVDLLSDFHRHIEASKWVRVEESPPEPKDPPFLTRNEDGYEL